MFTSFFFTLIVGALAGWIAAKIVSGQGFGLLTNIVVGMLGAAIAGYLFPAMGMGGGFFAVTLQATIGSVILLVVLRLFKRL